jgi:nucleotide-binding universal stress UspA family protein
MLSHGTSDVYIQIPDAQAGGGGMPLQRIFVPVDSYGQSDPALVQAARLSAVVGGQVRLIHVRLWDPVPRSGGARFYLETSEQATEVLYQALTRVWACGASASGVVVDAPRNRVARAIAAARVHRRPDRAGPSGLDGAHRS